MPLKDKAKELGLLTCSLYHLPYAVRFKNIYRRWRRSSEADVGALDHGGGGVPVSKFLKIIRSNLNESG